MQDTYASIVALARTMLMDTESPQEMISVKTASLRLVLETLIEIGGGLPSPLPDRRPTPSAQAVADGARRSVAGQIAAVDLELNPPETERPRGRL